MAITDPVPVPKSYTGSSSDAPALSPPEPQAYQGFNQNPTQRQPFEPPGFVSPLAGGTVNQWQTGNELLRSEMGVNFLLTTDPLRGFKW